MKFSPFFGALLLLASPAWADHFHYLKCDVLTSLATKQVDTNQVLERNQIEEEAFFKVDTTNGRVTINKTDWEGVTIANGIAYYEATIGGGFRTLQSQFTLEFSPPGRFNKQVMTTIDDAFQEEIAKGFCQSSDEATFERAFRH